MHKALVAVLGAMLLTVPISALADHNPGHDKRSSQADVAQKNPQADPPGLDHEDDDTGTSGVHVNPNSGSNRSITAQIPVSDDNGHNDIEKVTCNVNAPNGTVHVANISASKATGSGSQATFDCDFNLAYYDAPGDYKVEAEVTDRDGNTDASNATFTYEELASSSLETETIDLSTDGGQGAIAPGNDTYDSPTKNTVTNTGNIKIDLQYSGLNFTNGTDEISIENLYLKTDGSSDFSTGKLAFSTSTQTDTTFDLPPGADSSRDLYFAIDVPEGIAPGTYTGETTLEAVADT